MPTIFFPCRYFFFFFFFFLGQSRGWWFNLLLLPGRRSNLALSKHCGLHNRCLVFLSCVYVCMSLLMHVCVCVVWMCVCVNVCCRPLMWCFWCLWVFKRSINMLMCSGRTWGPCGSPRRTHPGDLWICLSLSVKVWSVCSSFCFSRKKCHYLQHCLCALPLQRTCKLIFLSLSLFFFWFIKTLITHAHIHTHTSLLNTACPLSACFNTLSVFES